MVQLIKLRQKYIIIYQVGVMKPDETRLFTIDNFVQMLLIRYGINTFSKRLANT